MLNGEQREILPTVLLPLPQHLKPAKENITKYLKCQQNHSTKPMSGAGSLSCRPYGKAMKK